MGYIRAGKEAFKRRRLRAMKNTTQHIIDAHQNGEKNEPHKVGRKGSLDGHKKELKILTKKLGGEAAGVFAPKDFADKKVEE